MCVRVAHVLHAWNSQSFNFHHLLLYLEGRILRVCTLGTDTQPHKYQIDSHTYSADVQTVMCSRVFLPRERDTHTQQRVNNQRVLRARASTWCGRFGIAKENSFGTIRRSVTYVHWKWFLTERKFSMEFSGFKYEAFRHTIGKIR